MNLYNLVFSEVRSVRIRRHLLFWAAWCIYLIVTYLIPTNWIPGWDLSGPLTHIKKYGIGLSVLRIIMASILHTLVHAALVYGILYYFLPRYLLKNKTWIGTTCILLLFVCLIAFINYFNFVLALYISTRIGYFQTMPGMDFILPLWGRQILFNYPTIIGIALAIKLLKSWYLKQKETAQAAREKINAELQLLKAQVHPHFLFNTLNNIYSFIINGSPAAPEVLKKLSALLHYIIYECNQPLVTLEKELKMINDYADLEKIRYGKSFNMNLQVRGNAEHKLICPLLLVPFVENSFKHGASEMLTHPWINLNIAIEDHVLLVDLSNSKPSMPGENTISGGLGLKNVKKRLAILYPGMHSLNITDEMMSFHITLQIPLFDTNEKTEESFIKNRIYELA